MNVCVKQEVVGGRKLFFCSGKLRQQYTLLFSVILCFTLLRRVSMFLLGTLAFVDNTATSVEFIIVVAMSKTCEWLIFLARVVNSLSLDPHNLVSFKNFHLQSETENLSKHNFNFSVKIVNT